ncbi:MAG: 50S ribosomal protein L11 methyltransferase [Verrucomicrobiales bacterium]|jgi:ribosomal protein L11 methyltransferase
MHVWSKLSSTKWRDAWEERFLGLGQTNAVIQGLPGGKRIRVDVYCKHEKEALAIAEQFGGRVRKVKNENWAAMAPPKRKPIKIRDTLLVTGEADPRQIKQLQDSHPARRILSIPAELAFGTGDHATTSTCLRILTDIAKSHHRAGRDWSMLDAGTGTGLLAIAASKLGAAPVEGFDFDPTAVSVARRNLERNRTSCASIYEADLCQWKPAGKVAWDVITANVFANVLTQNLLKLSHALAPEGHLILSGILLEHKEEVLAAADKTGLPRPESLHKGKWVTLHYQGT